MIESSSSSLVVDESHTNTNNDNDNDNDDSTIIHSSVPTEYSAHDIGGSPLSSSTFLVHKPVDVLCSKAEESVLGPGGGPPGPPRQTIFELAQSVGFPHDYNLVGRLDAATSGLILFTNNLRLLSAINHPIRPHWNFKEEMLPFKEKEYVAIMRPGKSVSRHWRKFGDESFDPVKLEEEMSKPFSFDKQGSQFAVGQSRVEFVRRFEDSKFSYGRPDVKGWCVEVRVILSEGKHHQIRRMARNCDYHVINLTRVRIAGFIEIETLPCPGTCRWLTVDEELRLIEGLRVYKSKKLDGDDNQAMEEDEDHDGDALGVDNESEG